MGIQILNIFKYKSLRSLGINNPGNVKEECSLSFIGKTMRATKRFLF